jgi:Rad3-related DNA helicase
MTRVIQSAGRLLRAESDRGVIALYGAPFLREPYRSLLPDAWLQGGDPEDLAGDPARAAREFFAREEAR